MRGLGRELGLHLSEKAESQEICFVTEGRYDAFIEAEGRDPGAAAERSATWTDARWAATRGTGATPWASAGGSGSPMGSPLYVVRTEARDNRVWVGPEAALLRSECVAREVTWCGAEPQGPLSCGARIRSRGLEAEALVIRSGRAG